MPRQTKDTADEPEVLTTHKVAEKLRVTPRTVQSMAAYGALPVFRVNRLLRFNAEAARHLMETHQPASIKGQVEEKIRSFDSLIGVRTGMKKESLLDAWPKLVQWSGP